MAATIKDVAERANTSTATVSKVMNGSYSISQATADRVHAAMQELGYHPNQRARNFSRRSTQTVMWLTSLEKDISFSNPHMFEIMCGLESALTQKDYMLMVKSISPQEAVNYIEEVYHAKLADGFVIHASVISPELDELIDRQAIPHIIVGMPSFYNHFSWIDIDNRLAGELAAKYLLEQGYQSLAFIGGTEADKISMHRLNGMLSVLNEHALILPKGHLQRGQSQCDSGYHMTQQVLNQYEKPDGIICANNYIAYGCMSALGDRGISVPEEIGVITFDDFPFSQILKPKLTVVNIDVFELGVQAGKYILQKLKKPSIHIQSYITYPILIARESTRKLV
jgi:DNA-binding LacI/PurR family transcriptional regulator